MQKKHHLLPKAAIFILAAAVLFSGQACTLSLFNLGGDEGTNSASATQTIDDAAPQMTPVPSAETQFTVHIPAPLNEGDVLAVSILDEVTGLAFNPANYPLEAIDAQTYTAALPLPLDAVVKYRYFIAGTNRSQETTSDNKPVRYRLYKVDGIGAVEDAVTSWTGKNFAGVTGHLQGIAIDSVSGQPIPNLLLSAGGVQTLTDSAGEFYLSGVLPGLHRIFAYSMDGAYQPFQQGAQVDAGLITPVQIHVAPAQLITVTFIAALPDNTVDGAAVHLAGNLLQLGNTFGDLNGGFNTTATRMPTLTPMADGRYSITLQLPIGTDLRYKYTLGDGFWNAEHQASGEHLLRRLIVPESDFLVEDKVETWQAGPSSAIAFDVTVPASTPAGDHIYIQFSPYAWTEPIPMWSMGNNHWSYKLYGPFDVLNNIGYRYCRNAQCGSADDLATRGSATPGRQITTSLAPQDIRDEIKNWVWLEDNNYTLVSAPIQARNQEFIAGIEFQSHYTPSWMSFTSQAIQNLKGLHANWAIITPTWTFSRTQPLVFNALPAQDPLWGDTQLMVEQSRALNLNTAIYPIPNFPEATDDWWINAPRDFNWWNDWFTRYRKFAVHHADIAARYDAQVLILGGDWLAPAMQNGMLADGQPSGVPADAELRWNAILADAHAHFNGEIWWALPYTPGSLVSAPPFISNVDGVYLLWDAPLSEPNTTINKDQMFIEATRLLDEEIAPYQASIEKEIIIGLAIPSAIGAEAACISDTLGGCLDWTALNRPKEDIPSVRISLQTQTDVYETMLNAINTRTWINGIVSRGYYPPVMLQDKSASIHGKPAADLLWYWYPRLLGLAQ